MNRPQATITVWGDFALFSRPESKVERMTYPVPTPSAARGILASIYSKPAEFYWQVQRIEVLKPIRYVTFKRNELKSKMPRIPTANPMASCLIIEDERTQRQSVVLQDVRSFTLQRRSCTISSSGGPSGGRCLSSPLWAQGSSRPISSGAPAEKNLSRKIWIWG